MHARRWIALIFFCLGTAPVAALELPGPLVEAEWLARHLEEVEVLDVREIPDSFTSEGHIPGAALVNWRKVQTTRAVDGMPLSGMVPGSEAFSALMRKNGVSNQRPVVITAPGHRFIELTEMARLYWTLRYYGHDRVALLAGGTAAWSAAGHPLSRAAPSPAEGDFLAEARPSLRATTRQVAGMTGASAQLVDVRTLGYYLGLVKEPYVDGYGHIPGAIPYPYTLALEGAPVRFRSRRQLEQLASAFGIDLNRPIIVYCNTGVLSAAGWFIFHELLGNSRTRLYDGSMHAWTRLGQPTETMTLNIP